MFFKLAFQNVRKSLRDYAVYFLTLTFGVCLFYVFNSMEGQQAMLQMSASKHAMMEMIMQVLGYFSVFISVVLGLLIVYANHFLMKRRKQELGIYLLLGMEKGAISRILLIETFFIGIFSLVVGLLVGMLASGGLSFVSSQLFEADYSGYQFVVSGSALGKSVLYFGVIFLIVMVFNTVEVGRLRLIDLLNAAKQNQRPVFRGLAVSLVLLAAGIACVGIAYGRILSTGLSDFSELGLTILLGCVGTVALFASLAGFLLRLLQRSRRIYYKNLNFFVLRNINSKINTNFISMSVICLLLFFSICVLSCGIGLAQASSNQLEEKTPYDFSMTFYLNSYNPEEKRDLRPEEVKLPEVPALLDKAGIPLEETFQEYGVLIERRSEKLGMDQTEQNATRKEYTDTRFGESYTMRLSEIGINCVSVSDFNRAMVLQGKDPVELGDSGYAVVRGLENSQDESTKLMTDAMDQHLKAGGRFTVEGRALAPISDQVITASMATTSYAHQWGTLVIPDDLAEKLTPASYTWNGRYRSEEGENTVQNHSDALFNSMTNRQGDEQDFGFFYETKESVYANSMGTRAMATYLAVYIGFVFLLTSAAVLSLQQLSEAADNAQRYSLLRKLGAEERMVRGALLSQIAMYFLLPLILACIHSVVGIKVCNDFISSMNAPASLLPIAFTAGVLLLIYGGYFIATYAGALGTIQEKTHK